MNKDNINLATVAAIFWLLCATSATSKTLIANGDFSNGEIGWTDDPDPTASEDGHQGARTVSRWHEDFLRDFAERRERCAWPASLTSATNSGVR